MHNPYPNSLTKIRKKNIRPPFFEHRSNRSVIHMGNRPRLPPVPLIIYIPYRRCLAQMRKGEKKNSTKPQRQDMVQKGKNN